MAKVRAAVDTMEYFDFEVRIARAEDGYTAHVIRSPAGEATTRFTLPTSDLELENFVLRVGRPRGGRRSIGSPEWESARTLGGELFEAIYTGDVRACLRSSLDRAELEHKGLRIKLRLLEAPELADWPWEYLYNRHLNRFLSLSAHTPIVRYIEMPEVMSPLTVEPPLCILVMISSPSDWPRLDVEREKAHLREALGGLQERGLVRLDWLEEASLLALQRRLRRGSYHIFHFIGHGGFDEKSQDGLLLMEDQRGQGWPVSGQYLGVMLHDHRTLRMAVLNACEGARSSRADPFAGAAATLVQQGIPAVVAMQFGITDEAAIVFASEFYTAIADGYPVDASLAEARKAIFATGNDVEWGTPVLYMRTPDGRIFGMAEPAPQEPVDREQAPEPPGPAGTAAEPSGLAQRQAQLSRLHAQALERLADRDWRSAHELLAFIEEMAPGYLDVPELLAQAREEAHREEEISFLHASALEHLGGGRWPEAIAGFQAVLELEPGHVEAAQRLTEAQAQQACAEVEAQAQQARAEADAQARNQEGARQTELARLYAAADVAAQAGEWSQAIVGFQAVQKLDAGYLDVAARLAGAQEALAAQEAARQQAARLADLYQQASERMEAQDWPGAQQLLDEIGSLDPSYRDVASLLSRVAEELHTLSQAVTARDFELAALGNSPAVARARAQAMADTWRHAAPGSVEVLLVPYLPQEQRPQGRITSEALESMQTETARREIQQALDERRPLGTTCLVNWARYKVVHVAARVVVGRHEDAGAVRQRVLDRLYQTIAPLPPAPNEAGYPFGQALREYSIYDMVRKEPGVLWADQVRLRVDEAPGAAVTCLAADHYQPQTWYAAAGDTLFRSLNDGDGWEVVGDFAGESIVKVCTHPDRAGWLAVATHLSGGGSRVYVSQDCGESWMESGGTPYVASIGFDTHDMVWTLRENAPLLFLATERGLYELALTAGAGPVQVLVDRDNQDLAFYAVAASRDLRGQVSVAVAAEAKGGIYLSSRGGQLNTFRHIGLRNEDIRVLAVELSATRSFLWAGAAATGGEAGRGCFRWELRGDEDPPEGWQPFRQGWEAGSCHALAFLSTGVAAATHRHGVMLLNPGQAQPAWQRPDVRCGLPLRDPGRFHPVDAVAARPDRGLILSGGVEGVHRSVDGGTTYTPVSHTVFEDKVTLPPSWLFCSGEHEIQVVSEDEASRD